MIVVGRYIRKYVLFPIDSDYNVIIEISKLQVLEKRNISLEVAFFSSAAIIAFGSGGEDELIFAKEAAVLIKMIVFDDSNNIWLILAATIRRISFFMTCLI